jgi:hypothetical protein
MAFIPFAIGTIDLDYTPNAGGVSFGALVSGGAVTVILLFADWEAATVAQHHRVAPSPLVLAPRHPTLRLRRSDLFVVEPCLRSTSDEQSDTRRTEAPRSDVAALGGTKQARRDLEDATDALEIAREACARLEADLADAQVEVLHRQNAVLAARNACLAPVIVAVIERAKAARLALAAYRALLSALLTGHERGPEFPDEMSGVRARDDRLAPLAGLMADADRIMLVGRTTEEESAAASAAAAMKQAVLKLTADASVEIPPLP